MPIDGDLLREALAARERLAQAQSAVDQTRPEYHAAVRRLHTAGASLRELAEVLRMSHQRVHQIVADPCCSFCGARKADVATLGAGPGIYICDRCVPLALSAIGGSGRRRVRAQGVVRTPTALLRRHRCTSATSRRWRSPRP